MRIPEYPPILTGNTQQDSYNLREYIIRNIEMLQQELLDAGGSIYVENGDVYVSIGGNTMTLQEFIEKNVNVDGDTINITVNATIETKADLQEKNVNVTENGDFSVSADEGKDGLSRVNLHVTVPADGPSGTIQVTENGIVDVTDYASAEVNVQPDLQSKSVTYATNGSRTITPDAGKDGLSSVAVTVNVPTEEPVLQSKSISPTSSQQVVTPDAGYDGLSQVTVAGASLQTRTVTPTAAGLQVEKSSGSYYGLQRVNVNGDANLIPGNIRNGVSIFGVAGTYNPSFQLQSKNVTPSTSAQTVAPDSGYDALSQVVVAATPLQTKSVTPSKSQQVITPASGYVGLSKVTVAGDADLIASNIKKDVNIFGVIGTYAPASVPINGSLIEITCSSNIDQVTATVNGHTYTAYLDTATHKAYVTIPYSDTTAARTCVLRGYIEGSQATSANLSMAKGVGYYTATLTTYEWLFKNGTWYGLDTHEWIRIAPSTYAGRITVTESDVLTMVLSSSAGSTRYAWVYLSPKLNNRGFSQLEIVVDSKLTEDPIQVYCGAATSSEHNPGIALSVGTNLIPLTVDDFYLEFYMNDWETRVVNATAVISSMRFV